MKHLKKYNESFNIYTDKDTFYNQHGDYADIIKDRLLELDDKGFYINVGSSVNTYADDRPSSYSITVTIEKSNNRGGYSPNRFFVNEILDDVISLVSNMNKEYSLSVMISHDRKYHKMVKIIGKTHIEQLENMAYQPINGLQLTFHRRKTN